MELRKLKQKTFTAVPIPCSLLLGVNDSSSSKSFKGGVGNIFFASLGNNPFLTFPHIAFEEDTSLSQMEVLKKIWPVTRHFAQSQASSRSWHHYWLFYK